MALLKQNKFDEAAVEFRAVAKLTTLDPSPLSNLCYVYFKPGKLSEGSDECDLALKVDPSWLKTYENLAAIRFAQGRDSDA